MVSSCLSESLRSGICFLYTSSAILQSLLTKQEKEISYSMLNTQQQVLVVGKSKKNDKLVGNTAHNKTTYFNGNKELIGQMVNVRIIKVNGNSLEAVIDA